MCKKLIIEKDMEDIYSRDVEWHKLNEKTIMITGATGMIASYMVYFLAYLVEKKQVNLKIIACVRNEEKAIRIFGELTEKDYFSIRYDNICELLNFDMQIDYIIHAASLASPQHYGVRPIAVSEPNAIGTYQLLKLAERKNVNGFLYFSTGDIYGRANQQNVYENTEGYVDPLDIHSCYNESKRMGETWSKIFWFERGVPAKVARIWHTYGPNMDIENDPRVFSSFVNDVVNDNDIIIKGNGEATRTFCYVTDAIEAFFRILFDGNNGEAYNVCNSQQCYSIKELANLIVELVPEKKLKVTFQKRENNENYIENKTYGQIIPRNDKLKKLGWKCRVNCKDGFDRIIRMKMEEKI